MSTQIAVTETERTRLVVEIPAITAKQIEQLQRKTGMTKTQLVIYAIDLTSRTLDGDLPVS